MERKGQKPVTKMSVPQFGGWEHKPHGVPTDYSMVFNMARENKKNHKTDLTEVKRLSVGNDQRVASNTPNHHHGRGRGRGHGHGHGPSHGHNYGHGPSHGPSHGYGPVPEHSHPHHAHADPPITGRRNILTYMNCFSRP